MPAAKLVDLNAKYPLTKLRGISTKRAEIFADLNIRNQIDLLFYFPRTYDDWSSLTSISDINQTGIYTFKATVARQPYLNRKGKLSWLRTSVMAERHSIDVTFFNQAWLSKTMRVGQDFIFHGKVEVSGSRRNIVNPSFIKPEESNKLGMLANYSLRKGLNQKLIRQAIEQVIDSGLIQKLSDPVPDFIRQKFNLASLEFAIKNIHQAKNKHELYLARYRLAFDEIFLMRSALEQGKEIGANIKARALVSTKEAGHALNDLRESLDFDLTNSQMQAINSVLRDLREDKPMNRLLQGDVGSGKTMVALFAALYVAKCGGQTMLMAPTSILAEQHYASFKKYLEAYNVHVEILLGSSKARERREIIEKCETGECQILIGTHALLQDDLNFKNLALAITDEQHRFGVRQRAKLGLDPSRYQFLPHRLSMTATPIPRSLALIFFHDLDMTIMRDMPKGRSEVITKLVKSSQIDKVYSELRTELDDGGQAYVICPLIEESESLDLDSAEATYLDLKQRVFPDKQVAILHGRMKAEEKDAIMEAFVAGDIDILVSTTVVEVGVDNQNASVMIVMSAERFGLAQLHQLRGRVGRGDRQSYCYLISDSRTEGAQERLEALVRIRDGFALAEEDLKQRGPGDYLGTRQSGLPAFQFLNIYEDQAIIEQAKFALAELENLDPNEREYWEVKRQAALFERYPELAQGLSL